MKLSFQIALAVLAVGAAPVVAQEANSTGLGEVVVTANRLNARYAQQDRPVVGLRRQADSAVIEVWFSSDAREEAVRKREIHTMLASALDKAGGSGVELVSGAFELGPVTKANYQELPLVFAGRVDTSKAVLMFKTKLAGSAAAAEQKLKDFAKSAPKSGRGAVDVAGAITLTIVNPDQYREAIVKLIAENARHYASVFGPDYAVQVNGIDAQISWSQVSSTDVFLYVPYHYTIVPK
jgi:hypothetical protein